jgi:hypothetical protein
MTNLAWIIPLSIWALFLLLVVPYRLAGKYKRQRNLAKNSVTNLQEEIANKTNRAQLRLELGTLIIEGAGILNAFGGIRTHDAYLPTSEFQNWIGKVTNILTKPELNYHYPLWYKAVSIATQSHSWQEYKIACEQGLSKLEEMFAELRD